MKNDMNTIEQSPADRRARLLEVSGAVLPFALGIAFSFSSYTYIGVALTLGISAWYMALGWKKVLSDRWSLIVIGFFLAITCKDAVAFVLKTESFSAFAKSGSRVFVLTGSAALLLSYTREKIERAFLIGYGIAAAWIAVIFILMRLSVVPWIYNPNEFGDLAMWFPLLWGASLYGRGDSKSKTLAALIFALGFALLSFDAVGMTVQGSRTAPLAFAIGIAFAIISTAKTSRWLGVVLLAAAVGSILFFSIVFIPQIDMFLGFRQELWQAYWIKAFQRPLAGWGFTQASDNIRYLEPLLRGKPIYQQFMMTGLGPHNSFLAMFFENGMLALIGFVAILGFRISRSPRPLRPFDIALIAYIVVISLDAMMAGGLTYLGYFLGICILAVKPRESSGGPERLKALKK